MVDLPLLLSAPNDSNEMAVTRAAGRAGKTVTNASKKAKAPAQKASESFPERTADGRYIVVNNRRWRATDPLIPEDELKELKRFLAIGRSGTRVAKGKGKTEHDDTVTLARKRTGLAKLGLGERGKPEWWEDSEDGRKKRWSDALAELRKLESQEDG